MIEMNRIAAVVCKAFFLAFAAMSCATVANAESVKVPVWSPARNFEAAMLNSLAVERFEDRDGPYFSIALERQLSAAEDHAGGRYFDVVDGYGARATVADGIISGVVSTDVTFERYTKKKRECANPKVKKCDDDDKIFVDIRCTRRFITINVSIRLVRTADDRIIYTASKPNSDKADWCRNEELPPEEEKVVTDQLNWIARQILADIAPRWSTDTIRFREKYDGVAKDDKTALKAIVRLVKTDVAAACTRWAALSPTSASHPTVMFNLALCAEHAGDLDRAQLLYTKMLTPDGRIATDVDASLKRIKGRKDGLAADLDRAESI